MKTKCVLYSNSQDVVVNRFETLASALLYYYNEVKGDPELAEDFSILIDVDGGCVYGD